MSTTELQRTGGEPTVKIVIPGELQYPVNSPAYRWEQETAALIRSVPIIKGTTYEYPNKTDLYEPHRGPFTYLGFNRDGFLGHGSFVIRQEIDGKTLELKAEDFAAKMGLVDVAAITSHPDYTINYSGNYLNRRGDTVIPGVRVPRPSGAIDNNWAITHYNEDPERGFIIGVGSPDGEKEELTLAKYLQYNGIEDERPYREAKRYLRDFALAWGSSNLALDIGGAIAYKFITHLNDPQWINEVPGQVLTNLVGSGVITVVLYNLLKSESGRKLLKKLNL
jgi:hypothetical protein